MTGLIRTWATLRLPMPEEKSRQWFKKQERTLNIERGRQLLEREVKRLGISLPNVEDLARLFNCDSYDDFLASIGSGVITSHQLDIKLGREPEPEPDLTAFVSKILLLNGQTSLGFRCSESAICLPGWLLAVILCQAMI